MSTIPKTTKTHGVNFERSLVTVVALVHRKYLCRTTIQRVRISLSLTEFATLKTAHEKHKMQLIRAKKKKKEREKDESVCAGKTLKADIQRFLVCVMG